MRREHAGRALDKWIDGLMADSERDGFGSRIIYFTQRRRGHFRTQSAEGRCKSRSWREEGRGVIEGA